MKTALIVSALIVLLGVAVVFGVLGWYLDGSPVNISWHGVLAMALGGLGTLLLGGGLMFLVFYSNRHGYDDAVDDRATRPAEGTRKLPQLKPPASEKMLETRPTASRSFVSGLVTGSRPARTSGWAWESSTGKLMRSVRVLPSRGQKLRARLGS